MTIRSSRDSMFGRLLRSFIFSLTVIPALSTQDLVHTIVALFDTVEDTRIIVRVDGVVRR